MSSLAHTQTKPSAASAPCVTWLTGLLLLIAVPPLLFSVYLPAWLPVVVVAYLVVLFIFRSIAVGRLAGHTPVDVPLFLLLLTLPVGLWASADLRVTLPRTYAFMAGLAVFAAVAVQRNPKLLPWFGWGVLLLALGLSVFLLPGTRFSASKLPFIDYELYSLLPGGFRPFWNLAGFNANLTGGLLALFVPPAVILTIRGRNWPQRGLAAFTLVVLMVMLLLAQSRGALIGIAIAIPVTTILYDRRWAWLWAGMIIVVLVLGLAFSGSSLPIEQVLGVDQVLGGNPLQGRVELWSRAIYMSQDFAFTGVGLGMYEKVMLLLYPTFLISPNDDIRHPHNLFLQHSAEMGIPALIAFVAMYLILGYILIRQFSTWGRHSHGPLALGLFGSLLVYLIHGQFEVITYAPRAAIFIWGLFGLMSAVGTADP